MIVGHERLTVAISYVRARARACQLHRSGGVASPTLHPRSSLRHRGFFLFLVTLAHKTRCIRVAFVPPRCNSAGAWNVSNVPQLLKRMFVPWIDSVVDGVDGNPPSPQLLRNRIHQPTCVAFFSCHAICNLSSGYWWTHWLLIIGPLIILDYISATSTEAVASLNDIWSNISFDSWCDI